MNRKSTTGRPALTNGEINKITSWAHSLDERGSLVRRLGRQDIEDVGNPYGRRSMVSRDEVADAFNGYHQD